MSHCLRLQGVPVPKAASCVSVQQEGTRRGAGAARGLHFWSPPWFCDRGTNGPHGQRSGSDVRKWSEKGNESREGESTRLRLRVWGSGATSEDAGCGRRPCRWQRGSCGAPPAPLPAPPEPPTPYQVSKAGCFDLAAIRTAAAIRDEVDAKFTLWGQRGRRRCVQTQRCESSTWGRTAVCAMPAWPQSSQPSAPHTSWRLQGGPGALLPPSWRCHSEPDTWISPTEPLAPQTAQKGAPWGPRWLCRWRRVAPGSPRCRA